MHQGIFFTIVPQGRKAANESEFLQLVPAWAAGFCLLLFAPALLCAGTAVATQGAALQVSVDPSGAYTITAADPPWIFGGTVGKPLSNLAVSTGTGNAGDYREIDFDYSDGVPRHGAILAFTNRNAVLFIAQNLAATTAAARFPSLAAYPQTPFHLAFNGTFGIYDFNQLPADSPWLFFDSGANAFIVSPASNFMVATTSQDAHGEIVSGINSGIASLPAGFTMQTLLVVEKGINRAFDTWGRAMTDLQGKTRPANNADRSLGYLGYWTDNTATYYYRTDPNLSYEDTLLAVRDDFARQGIPLGYLQLDSWFYPKGATATWQDYTSGISQYVGDPTLFPDTLKGFQQQLGVPLITHARWIDASSPYRQQYQMSGDVAVDPAYWDSVASYLQDAGALTYEQDWLSAKAQTACNLADPDAFLGNMASSMANHGLTIQYSMAFPRHFLQSSKYNNVTTIRVSGDGFGRGGWDSFLYGSRLAGALGLWPWSDVFQSTQTQNLLLSTLSAGPVGVGDPIGSLSGSNLFQSIRGDGAIVKPDVPLVPLDQTILGDAQGSTSPMVAATYTDFGEMKAVYVFAYGRGGDMPVSFTPASLGLSGSAYIYNYFGGTGQLLDAAGTFADTAPVNGVYYIVVPVGPSGIAFLGDAGQFVSLGKQRISAVSDRGRLQAGLVFAAGETVRVLRGYSPSPPVVLAIDGQADAPVYDRSTGLFTVAVSPGADSAALLNIRRRHPPAKSKFR
jgi:hypothetical protein